MSLPSPARHPLPASAPVWVRDLLRAAPDGPAPVVHRGPQALYVDVGGSCVGVLAAGATRVPCGLRTRVGNFSPDSGSSAYLEAGVLHIDGRPLAVGRVVDVHVPRFDRGELLRNTTGSITCTATPPPAAVVEFVACRAPEGITAGSVARLVGHGNGLTPLGDDVLCGWLAVQRSVGAVTPEVDAEIRSGSSRTTLLSATLLDCAIRGEVLPELGDWLSAAACEDRRHLSRCADALLAIGATSGAGLMTGALLAFGSLASLASAAESAA